MVNDSILRHLQDRKTQILAVESFAAVAAPWISPEEFKDEDVLWWVDNLAACSSLIRGAAKPEDIDLFASISSIQFAALGGRPWYEWIDSDSNPSDGLSRDGIVDVWTRAQGWDLAAAEHPSWETVLEALV